MKRATLILLFILLPAWALCAAPARAGGGLEIVDLRCETPAAPAGWITTTPVVFTWSTAGPGPATGYS